MSTDQKHTFESQLDTCSQVQQTAETFIKVHKVTSAMPADHASWGDGDLSAEDASFLQRSLADISMCKEWATIVAPADSCADEVLRTFAAAMQRWFPAHLRRLTRLTLAVLSKNTGLQESLVQFKAAIPDVFMNNQLPEDHVDLSGAVEVQALAYQAGDAQLQAQLAFLVVIAHLGSTVIKLRKACNGTEAPAFDEANITLFLDAQDVLSSVKAHLHNPDLADTFASASDGDGSRFHLTTLDNLVNPVVLADKYRTALHDECTKWVGSWTDYLSGP